MFGRLNENATIGEFSGQKRTRARREHKPRGLSDMDWRIVEAIGPSLDAGAPLDREGLAANFGLTTNAVQIRITKIVAHGVMRRIGVNRYERKRPDKELVGVAARPKPLSSSAWQPSTFIQPLSKAALMGRRA